MRRPFYYVGVFLMASLLVRVAHAVAEGPSAITIRATPESGFARKVTIDVHVTPTDADRAIWITSAPEVCTSVIELTEGEYSPRVWHRVCAFTEPGTYVITAGIGTAVRQRAHAETRIMVAE